MAESLDGMLATLASSTSTRGDYQRKIRAMFRAMPSLAAVSVADLERDHVAQLWEAMADHVCQRRHAVRLLAATIDRALAAGQRTGENPARGWAGGKSRARSKRPAIDLGAQIWATLDRSEAEGHVGSEFADFFRLALLLGLHHTELCRLRWRDVELDVEPARITVWLKRGQDETVPIGPIAAGILRRRRPEAAAGWVWPNSTNGRPRVQSWIAVNWDRLLEQLRQDGVDVFDRATGEAYTASCTRSINLHIKTREGAREGISLMAAGASVGHTKASMTARYCPATTVEIVKGNNVVENMIAGGIVTPRENLGELAIEAPPDVRAEAIGARIRAHRERLGLSPKEAASKASAVITDLVRQGREVARPVRTGMSAELWTGWERRCGTTEKIEIAAKALGLTFAALAEGR